MNFWGRTMQAVRSGVIAATRSFSDPGQTQREQTHDEVVSHYNLLWAYYQNKMFDAVDQAWRAYKEHYNLYRNMRLPYNPMFRLTEFYAGKVYPGLLSR